MTETMKWSWYTFFAQMAYKWMDSYFETGKTFWNIIFSWVKLWTLFRGWSTAFHQTNVSWRWIFRQKNWISCDWKSFRPECTNWGWNCLCVIWVLCLTGTTSCWSLHDFMLQTLCTLKNSQKLETKQPGLPVNSMNLWYNATGHLAKQFGQKSSNQT